MELHRNSMELHMPIFYGEILWKFPVRQNNVFTVFASKQCEAEGRWYHVSSGEEWTNYSTCSLVPNLKKRAYVSIAAYAVTIVAIIPALAIFSIYRSLKHLIICFQLNYIIKKKHKLKSNYQLRNVTKVKRQSFTCFFYFFCVCVEFLRKRTKNYEVSIYTRCSIVIKNSLQLEISFFKL
jgi:hypothetical protein